MKTLMLKSGLATLALAAMAAPALAHIGVGTADGLAAGLGHPFAGPDHLLAMAAVGIWSALAMPDRLWIAPAAFVTTMIGGALVGFAGLELPAVESMIALSVFALGVMIIAGAGPAPGLGMGLVIAFALFHGHAHASEATGAALAYIAGVAASTTVLHVLGLGIGLTIAASHRLREWLGAVVSGAGAVFLFAV
jgi:urease accessory protein